MAAILLDLRFGGPAPDTEDELQLAAHDTVRQTPQPTEKGIR